AHRARVAVDNPGGLQSLAKINSSGVLLSILWRSRLHVRVSRRQPMLRHPAICVCIVAFLIPSAAYSQTGQSISVPPDSPRWDLQEAKVTEYQGRKCLLLDGAAAVVKDFEMRDGVIDVDV